MFGFRTDTPDEPAGIALTPALRRAWLRLIRTENVGAVTFRQLINRFGTATAALDALPELSARGGRRIQPPPWSDVDREMETAERLGARFIGMGEPDYPPSLRQIEATPPLLAVLGGVALLTRPMVAIVGARNASVAGRKMAAQLATGIGEAGLVIASGLARGIDAAAHAAALDVGTVAVMAGGLDRLYPPENTELARRIVETGGALLSEMPFGWEPRARDFPRRNRLISGLSLGVVVVEAALRSGSLHTARFAGEQGRLVMAVPGSPLDARAEGANALIREGAILIANAGHVIEAVSPQIDRLAGGAGAYEPPQDLASFDEVPGEARRRIVEALSVTPTPVDDIIRATGLSARVVTAVLLELDLAGRLERHRQGRVSLII